MATTQERSAMNRLFGLVVLVCAVAAPLRGQADSAQTAGTYGRECWRGKPAPLCDSFFISELGFDGMLFSPTRRWLIGTTEVTKRELGNRLRWTLGPMFNMGPSRAMGITFSVAPQDRGAWMAVAVRNRMWIPGENGFDLSLGGIWVTGRRPPGAPDISDYGAMVNGAYVVRDLVQVNLGTELLFTPGPPRLGASLGVGLGSQPATLATIAIPLLAVLRLFAFGR
jgi:hypothetical protein